MDSVSYPFVVQNGTVYLNQAYIGNASITNTNIANGAVDNAKIQNAAISNAQIQDGAITNAKIANAAISNAQIQDAAITSAKIGNAQVSTLQLAGEAVTVSRAAYNSGSGSGIQTPVSIVQPAQSVACIVTASVILGSSTGNTILVQIRRDGTVIYQTNVQTRSGAPMPTQAFSTTIVDTSGSGGSTYDLTITPNGSGSWFNASITCMGCKR